MKMKFEDITMKFICCVLIIGTPLFAQFWYENTEGVSVAAMGRGGTGIAVGGDPAGVWHNPASLAQIPDEQVGMALDYLSTDDKYHALTEKYYDFTGTTSEIERIETKNDHAEGDWFGLAYFSAVKPMMINRKRIVLQAGYRRLVSFPDMNGSLIQIDEWEDSNGTIIGRWEKPATWARNAHGGIDDWGMACAIEAMSGLSLGLNAHFMNANYGSTTVSEGRLDRALPSRITDDFSFSGLLWDLGIRVQVHPTVALGAVYRSGLKTGMDYYRARGWPDLSDPNFQEIGGHTTVHWPDGYGAGVAWGPSTPWLLTLDYSRMNWSKGRLDEYAWYDGYFYKDIAYPSLFFPQWDTASWRLGMEYRLPTITQSQWVLRAGYYRQEQMVNQAAGWGVEAAQPLYHGFTAGAELKIGKMQLDLAVDVLRGEESASWEEVGGDLVIYHANSQETQSTRLMLSGIVLLD